MIIDNIFLPSFKNAKTRKTSDEFKDNADNVINRLTISGGVERLSKIDDIKAFGLIFMVIGHSGAPIKLSHWINLFHMAIFFCCSGFLWSDRNAESITNCKRYIVRKIKSLWVPYAIATSIFLALNNVFLSLGIYSNGGSFLKYCTGTYDTLTEPITINIFFKSLFGILVFHTSTQMGGALWFFRCLFVVSVGHCLLRYLISRSGLNKKLCFISIFIISAICTELVNRGYLELFRSYRNVFPAYTAYLVGILLRYYAGIMDKFEVKRTTWALATTAFFIILLLLSPFGRISLATGYTTNILFYLASTGAGWFLLYSIANLIGEKVEFLLGRLCSHSIAIIVLHFLCFKVVSYIYLLFSKRDMLQLACFPTVHDAPWFLWLFYSVVGILLSWAVDAIYKKLKYSLKDLFMKINGFTLNIRD